MSTVSTTQRKTKISPNLCVINKRVVEVIHLTMDDQQRFADALLSPPNPSPTLRHAMKRHDKLLRTECVG
jgi:hypothetical protein